MSLAPEPIAPVPDETARVARAAFPHGTVATRLRDEFGSLSQDEDFRALFPRRGQPGLPPWQLALVTVLQFLEDLSDRQAAEAVRARIDWQQAGTAAAMNVVRLVRWLDGVPQARTRASRFATLAAVA